MLMAQVLTAIVENRVRRQFLDLKTTPMTRRRELGCMASDSGGRPIHFREFENVYHDLP